MKERPSYITRMEQLPWRKSIVMCITVRELSGTVSVLLSQETPTKRPKHVVTNTYPRMGASYSSNPCDHWTKKPGRRRLWPRIQNRTDGGGQGCPYHPFSARDYVCPGFANPVDRRNTARSKVMKLITFLCQYEGRGAYYLDP
jgi:hypothetical protein